VTPTPTITVGGLRASAGDHICAFFRGREEWERIVVPFLREGVRAGEICLCITGGSEHRRVSAAVLDAGDEAGAGLLRLEASEEVYLQGGTFSSDRMLSFWADWGEQTFTQGGHHFGRAVSDISWAEQLFATPVLDDFLAYEVLATRYARSYPQVALCLFDLEKFRGDVILPVLKVHPKVFFGGVLIENPYYVDPEELPVPV